MLNDQAKKEVSYFVGACSLLLPLLIVTRTFLNTPSVTNIYAKTPPTSIDGQSNTIVLEVEDIGGEDGDNSPEERSPQYSKEEIANYIVDVFGYGEDARMALEVAWCESRLDQSAYNENSDGTYDVGVFQINSVHNWRGNAWDIEENVRIAKEIFDEQGWWPWVCWWKYELWKI